MIASLAAVLSSFSGGETILSSVTLIFFLTHRPDGSPVGLADWVA